MEWVMLWGGRALKWSVHDVRITKWEEMDARLREDEGGPEV